MVEVMKADEPAVAFFWSANTGLPSDWRQRVSVAQAHPAVRVLTPGDDEIWIEPRTSAGLDTRVAFHFSRGRGAGQVRHQGNDVCVLAALRVAQLLDLELSDAAGNVLAKERPFEWLRRIPFAGEATAVEDLAVKLGLVPQRFNLSELATESNQPDAAPLFF